MIRGIYFPRRRACLFRRREVSKLKHVASEISLGIEMRHDLYPAYNKIALKIWTIVVYLTTSKILSG